MKKRLYITSGFIIAMALLSSCNDGGYVIPESENTNSEVTNDSKYFLRAEVDNKIDLSILQVENTININFYSDAPDIKPTIESITENAVYHQKLNVDYSIISWNTNKIEDSNYKSTATIKLLKPGTFRLVFKANSEDGETTYSNELVFSVVKINTWTKNTKIKDSSNGVLGIGGSHSIHLVEYFYSIDNGDLKYDNYLENEKFGSYIATFEGNTQTGTFSVGKEAKFQFDETRKGDDGRPYNSSSRINLTLKSPQVTITYKDIPIKKHY